MGRRHGEASGEVARRWSVQFATRLALVAAVLSLSAPQAFGQQRAAKEAREQSKDNTQDSPRESSARESSAKKLANDIADIIDNLDYPELQVVPRASERLRLEAKDEESNFLFAHWPLQLSGLSTLGVGLMSSSMQRADLTETMKADMKSVTTVTQAVGAGWLVAGLAMGIAKPYRSGLNRIASLNGKDERTLLLRERLAEESLERPARFIKPLITASVITNLSMNVLMGSYMTDQGRIIAGVSAVLAFLPAIFDDPVVVVYEKHLEYKKKIYGPVSSTGIGFDPRGKTYFPQMALTWRF